MGQELTVCEEIWRKRCAFSFIIGPWWFILHPTDGNGFPRSYPP